MEQTALNELKSILNDTESGSAEILEKINSFIITHNYKLSELKSAIKEIDTQFPLFAGIQTYLSELYSLLASNSIDEIVRFAKKFNSDLKAKFKRIYQNAQFILQNHNRIISISNSHTLFKYFQFAQNNNQKFAIFILESQPCGEGKTFYSKLKSIEIDAKLREDSQLKETVQQIDAAIIGCDMISESGFVVNKIGSRHLAEECRDFNKPFYVLGDNSKIISDKTLMQKINHSSKTIRGELFEIIEKDLITQIITD